MCRGRVDVGLEGASVRPYPIQPPADRVKERKRAILTLQEHIAAFADLMTKRHGRQLERWITAADASGLPELRSFITGLRRDQDAVVAGLTLPYSSGVVEGHINRIKMLKRQMYGRASPDLLRRRILLAD